MKRKLTLSVEESLIKSGKAYARKRGTSLSQLVEDRLRELAESDGLSFAERWRGCMKIADRPGDPRMEFLKKRYGL